jgi:hypothetical protein
LLRFSLVKHLNAWDSLAILLLEGRADCRVLYATDVKIWFNVEYRQMSKFIDLYGKTFPSGGSAWPSLRKLANILEFTGKSPENITADVFCSYVKQLGAGILINGVYK